MDDEISRDNNDRKRKGLQLSEDDQDGGTTEAVSKKNAPSMTPPFAGNVYKTKSDLG